MMVFGLSLEGTTVLFTINFPSATEKKTLRKLSNEKHKRKWFDQWIFILCKDRLIVIFRMEGQGMVPLSLLHNQQARQRRRARPETSSRWLCHKLMMTLTNLNWHLNPEHTKKSRDSMEENNWKLGKKERYCSSVWAMLHEK